MPFELDQFEIMDTLGTGTFGRVRLAKHNNLNKYYALKIMKKSNIIELKQVRIMYGDNHFLKRENYLEHDTHST